jgi:hypothetical protein
MNLSDYQWMMASYSESQMINSTDELSSTDKELSLNDDDSEDESPAVEPFRLMDCTLVPDI